VISYAWIHTILDEMIFQLELQIISARTKSIRETMETIFISHNNSIPGDHWNELCCIVAMLANAKVLGNMDS